MTDDDKDEVRKRHKPRSLLMIEDFQICECCRDAIRLADEVDRLKGRIEDYKLACSQRDEIIRGQDDRIARLREVLSNLVARVDKFVDRCVPDEGPDWEYSKLDIALSEARAALEKK